jgi:hypothetical protein
MEDTGEPSALDSAEPLSTGGAAGHEDATALPPAAAARGGEGQLAPGASNGSPEAGFADAAADDGGFEAQGAAAVETPPPPSHMSGLPGGLSATTSLNTNAIQFLAALQKASGANNADGSLPSAEEPGDGTGALKPDGAPQAAPGLGSVNPIVLLLAAQAQAQAQAQARAKLAQQTLAGEPGKPAAGPAKRKRERDGSPPPAGAKAGGGGGGGGGAPKGLPKVRGGGRAAGSDRHSEAGPCA